MVGVDPGFLEEGVMAEGVEMTLTGAGSFIRNLSRTWLMPDTVPQLPKTLVLVKMNLRKIARVLRPADEMTRTSRAAGEEERDAEEEEFSINPPRILPLNHRDLPNHPKTSSSRAAPVIVTPPAVVVTPH